MYILISNTFADALRQQPSLSGELWGYTLDDDSVVRLLGPLEQTVSRRVGHWSKQTAPAQPAPDAAIQTGELWLKVNPTSLEMWHYEPSAGWQPQPFNLVNFYTDYYSRTQGLFDKNQLINKKVVVAGLGSGGAFIASELAKAGVGHFSLIDFDRLEVHNLTRHICGFNDLGRLKIAAVRDYLLNINPAIEVEIHDFDITTDFERLTRLVNEADLVVGATDKEAAKSVLNQAAWHAGVPGVYGAAYDLGFGGDIFLAQPPTGPCYECFRFNTSNFFGDDSTKPEINYNQPVATFEPALGLDVRMIGLITARAALTTLLAHDPTGRLQPYPGNWILWCNQAEVNSPFAAIFDRALQSDFITLEANPICPVCQEEAYVQTMLGVSAEEARQQMAKLDIPTLPAHLVALDQVKN